MAERLKEAYDFLGIGLTPGFPEVVCRVEEMEVMIPPDFPTRVKRAPGYRSIIRSAQSLTKRRRGEEKFLEPIWKRVERGESPAAHAREIMQREGMTGLLNWASVNRD